MYKRQAIVELATTNSINLLEIDDEHAAALAEAHPFYTTYPIPGGSYKGVDEEMCIRDRADIGKFLADGKVKGVGSGMVSTVHQTVFDGLSLTAVLKRLHTCFSFLKDSSRIGMQLSITIIVTVIIYKYKEMSRGFFLKIGVSIIIL